MTRSQRLKPVVEITEKREKEAAKVFASQQQMLEQERKRLTELRAFREEYHRGYETKGAGGITAGWLRQWQRFLANLDRAIEQQSRAVAAAERQAEQKRRLWLNARGRSQAMGSVVERYRTEERRDDDRRAQKESDEIAQRKGRKID